MTELTPFLLTLAGSALVIGGAYWFLLGRRKDLSKDRRVLWQLVLILMTIAAGFILVFELPVDREDRGQLLSILTLAASAMIAYTSSSLIGSVAGGIALRLNSQFNVGEFVRVGEIAGRVVDIGLLDTEIQNVDRELVSVPNSMIVGGPIVRTPRTGALISANVSLGYATHHGRAEDLLVEAAQASGLSDAFVHVLELGDFSVCYRVAGVLADDDSPLSARSKLHRAMLDSFHGAGIEIMSPEYARKQTWPEQERVIPTPGIVGTHKTDEVRAEDVVFEKAERAEEIVEKSTAVKEMLARLEGEMEQATEDQKPRISAAIDRAQAKLEELRAQSSALADGVDDGGQSERPGNQSTS